MPESIQALIDLALSEDVGSGDVTCEYFIPKDRRARAMVTARGNGVVSGVELAALVFTTVDSTLEIECLIPDGSHVSEGAILIQVEGKARSILTAERTALNFLQRLSGVATLTALHVEEVKDSPTRILDTRKTTPGYRQLEKQAVLDGGGTNHRMGLYDMALVKDNHVAAAGGIAEAYAAVIDLEGTMPVEIEVDDLDSLRIAIEAGADEVLIDNFSTDDMAAAVALRDEIAPDVRLEASGGLTLERAAEVAATGVDYIAVGELTHSVRVLDLGLDWETIADD